MSHSLLLFDMPGSSQCYKLKVWRRVLLEPAGGVGPMVRNRETDLMKSGFDHYWQLAQVL